MIYLYQRYKKEHGADMAMEGGGKIKKAAVTVFVIINVMGVGIFFIRLNN